MKFTASQNQLFAVMSPLATIVPTKSPMPVLTHLMARLEKNRLKLTATDLEISLENSIEVEGHADGEALLPARKMVELLRELPDVKVTVETEKSGRVTVTDEQGKRFKISAEVVENYPKVPSLEGAEIFKIPKQTLRRMISKSLFAVSRDELRPQLTGLYLMISKSEIRVVTTDGHRLVKMTTTHNGYSGKKQDVIVPAKAMQTVSRIAEGDGDAEILFGERQLGFRIGDTVLNTKLIEGRYPNYDAVIPSENKNILKLDLDQFGSAVRRAVIFSNEISRQIRLKLSNDSVEINVEDIEQGNEGHETVPCDYKGEPMEIGYNASYVLDVLKQVDTGEVRFELGSPTSAGVVRPAEQEEKEDLLMLIMPVRLN